MTCGIYLIRSTLTGDCYVGASKNIEERWETHKRPFRNPKSASAIRRLIQQHGASKFKFEVLEECLADELWQKEEVWHERLKPSLNLKLYRYPRYRVSRADKSRSSVMVPNVTARVRFVISIQKELASIVQRWADNEKRSFTAQLEVIIEAAIARARKGGEMKDESTL